MQGRPRMPTKRNPTHTQPSIIRRSLQIAIPLHQIRTILRRPGELAGPLCGLCTGTILRDDSCPNSHAGAPPIHKEPVMSRSGAVTFKGTPLTLAGEAIKVGQQAPDFTLHYFEGGLKTIKLADLKGKPSFISVVPSLDTPVCQKQTKKFSDELGALGDRVNAMTVSLDLPFAQNRFCGAENIKNLRNGSDYMDRN